MADCQSWLFYSHYDYELAVAAASPYCGGGKDVALQGTWGEPVTVDDPPTPAGLVTRHYQRPAAAAGTCYWYQRKKRPRWHLHLSGPTTNHRPPPIVTKFATMRHVPRLAALAVMILLLAAVTSQCAAVQAPNDPSHVRRIFHASESTDTLAMHCPQGSVGCVCTAMSECKACDPFEIAQDNELAETEELLKDEGGWCAATGFKQLLECTFDGNKTMGTYHSCSVEQSERNTFFIFEALCLFVGVGSFYAVRKRQVELMRQVQQQLQDRIDSA